MRILQYLIIMLFSSNVLAIESLGGFLITAHDDRFKVVSPEKFKNPMVVVVENKTLIRLIGRLVVNREKIVNFLSIDPAKYSKSLVVLKKGDVLHFIPLSPAFQEVELIVGNKNYEIPPVK